MIKLGRVGEAKRELSNAIHGKVNDRANAEWLNGYRAGRNTDDSETERLYRKEKVYWQKVDANTERIERAVRRLIRAVRDGDGWGWI